MSDVATRSVIKDVLAHVDRHEVQANLRLRHEIKQATRDHLVGKGFVEVDTPTIAPRLDEYPAGHVRVLLGDGEEQVLTQSPQLFKQILIAHGVPRYFQFAHCFRDEDPDPDRTDVLREFVQIDVELQAERSEEVRAVAEGLVAAICDVAGLPCDPPFPIVDAVECMERWGTDRPDLRSSKDEMSFLWVVDFPLLEAGEGERVLLRHPMAMPHEDPTRAADPGRLRTHSYDLVLNGYEISSGDLRIHDPELQEHVIEACGLRRDLLEPLLEVLAAGVPPHGGLAIGLDRLVMQLSGAPDIADATAFPLWSGR